MTIMPKTVGVLLLVFAIIFPSKVAGNGNCTEEQKQAIMRLCAAYIYPRKPGGVPATSSACCRKVREVGVGEMECIVQLLPIKDQTFYGKRIRDLGLVCALSPPPHRHQVMAQRNAPVIPVGV
ncbi:unnamed protein product [Urochloa decumbens]|uniref:Bifunctional inhibitor/plant lipid transfer protein/seed storage helical domain-containing protein n=1 Tax=Urochloa decumbens TaxID=240449 RepID=A0ABC9AWN0_9POAL